MTWPDVVLIVVLIIFLAMGARLGSVWTTACLGGGFAGAILADLYALPVAGYVPALPAGAPIAAVFLFIGGVIAILLPGWLLSTVVKGVFLGVVDGIVGFVAGGFVGMIAVTLALLMAVPLFPTIERAKPWKKSSLVRPLYEGAESVMSGAPLPLRDRVTP